MYTKCLSERRIPTAWKNAKMTIIFKKGNQKDLTNYIPLCLLSDIYKVLTKVLTKRLEKTLDNTPIYQYTSTTLRLRTLKATPTWNIDKAKEKNTKTRFKEESRPDGQPRHLQG